jgi:hypothetical protein
MAGIIKDFFDRTYEELKDDRSVYKKPYSIVITPVTTATVPLLR